MFACGVLLLLFTLLTLLFTLLTLLFPKKVVALRVYRIKLQKMIRKFHFLVIGSGVAGSSNGGQLLFFV
jgi:hypothetical protein